MDVKLDAEEVLLVVSATFPSPRDGLLSGKGDVAPFKAGNAILPFVAVFGANLDKDVLDTSECGLAKTALKLTGGDEIDRVAIMGAPEILGGEGSSFFFKTVDGGV